MPAQLSIVGVEEPAQQADFDTFWLVYARHVAKAEARKAWARIPASKHAEIITAAAAWRRVWAAKELEFIPHAATWLRGERWEDELPAGVTVTAAAHVAFAQQAEPEPKGELPEHVRALIAKLKGQR